MRFQSIPSHLSLKPFDWASRIKDSSSNSKWREVLSHYCEAKIAGVELENPSVFNLIIKACSNLSFSYGRSLHGLLIKKGFESHTSISNSFMDFYAKSSYLDSTVNIFNRLGDRDSISWNIVVYGHLSQGGFGDGLRWFEKARFGGFEPNNSTLVLVIQACRNLGAKEAGKKLHGYLIRSGFLAICSVRNSLLSMYAESDVDNARNLFDEMPERDVISWSAMVKGYVYSGEPETGLKMFLRSVSEVEPDEVTVVSVLKACACLADKNMGTLVHGLAIRRGLDFDVFVGNSLIDMYSKCSDPDSALDVFNEMPRRNEVSWNSVISGFVLNENHSEALSLFGSMREDGTELDEVSIVNVLQICKCLVEPSGLRSVHCFALRRGHELNGVVLNLLVDAYAKSGLVDYAKKIFHGIERNSRSEDLWSTMIVGLAKLGRLEEAIGVFGEMVRARKKPDPVTVANLLEACSASAELRRAKWAHAIATRSGLLSEEQEGGVSVGMAILNAYSKCGEIEACKRVFDRIRRKTTATCSAMISAYGLNGLASRALALLEEMELEGVKVNPRTALNVLSACSHGGLVEEGVSFLESMPRAHGIEPGSNHYSCAVDMLGRAGNLEAARELIKRMPGQGLVPGCVKAWGSLLGACKRHGNAEIGSEAASRVIEFEPLDPAGYLIASAVYASSGLWVEVGNVRRLVKERGVRVVAGCSVVHVGDASFKFVAGDCSHLKYRDINSTVEFLHCCISSDKDVDFGVDEMIEL